MGKPSSSMLRTLLARRTTSDLQKGSDKMSDRKQTPDVLADILGSGIGSAPGEPAPSEPPRSAAPRRPASTKAAEPGRAANKAHRWEYLVVSCQHYRGWRPRYESGNELADWTRGPLLPAYLKERGNQGWELVAACSGRPMFGVTDYYQLFFRRPTE